MKTSISPLKMLYRRTWQVYSVKTANHWLTHYLVTVSFQVILAILVIIIVK